jgi:hypothetical protein
MRIRMNGIIRRQIRNNFTDPTLLFNRHKLAITSFRFLLFFASFRFNIF